MIGSGFNSYWFSTKNLQAGLCCNYITQTDDVCRDDWGDYHIRCDKCGDYIQIWKDEDDG